MIDYHDIRSVMLRPGETVYEARRRMDAVRARRLQWRAPVDKLAERDRLTLYWKAAYPQWQPELCRIDPNFALVHADSFRPGMNFGHLSLLSGHVPPHIARRQWMKQLRPAPPAQGYLFQPE